MSASHDLCSTAGFVLESEAVEVNLSDVKPLTLVNIELVSRKKDKCEHSSGPR